MGPVIGLTGSFGSGCSFIAERYLVPAGYQYVSLSAKLKELYPGADRHELQLRGNELRAEYGADYLAKVALETMSKSPGKWVVDSIRNPGEVKSLKSEISGFFLFAVFADRDLRWFRVKSKYKGNEDSFDEDDRRDTGENETTSASESVIAT